MIFFLLIPLLLSPLLYAAIDWKPYIPKNVKDMDKVDVKFDSVKVKVPADYSKADDPIKLDIYLRRFKKGSPKWNIIILAGGPGQGTEVYQRNVVYLSMLFKDNFAIYTIDHRGVGYSTKIISKKVIENDPDWPLNIEKYLKESKFPIKTLTISNTARDVLFIANLIKKDSGYDPSTSKLAVVGASYGTHLALRTMHFDSEMFDVMILDSPFIPQPHSIDADEGLLKACQSSKVCSEKIGPNVEYIRNISSWLLTDTHNNQCARILQKRFEKFELSWTYDGMTRYFFFNDKSIINASILALYYHAWTCPDPTKFEKALEVYENDLKGPKFETDDIRGGVLTLSDSKKMPINTFVLFYLIYSELNRDYLDKKKIIPCAKIPMGLFNSCERFSHDSREGYLMKKYFNPLKKYAYEPDDLLYKPITTKKTKMYFGVGLMDFRCPYRSAMRQIDRISAPVKRTFLFDNATHCPISTSDCSLQIVDEIFYGKSSSSTDMCLSDLNNIDIFSRVIVWPEGKNLKPLPHEPNLAFSSPNPGLNAPRLDLDNPHYLKESTKRYIFIGIGIIIAILILSALIYVFIRTKTKTRNRKRQEKNLN